MNLKAHIVMQQRCFFCPYYLANLMTNWAKIFTGLVFYAYVGIHQVRNMVFDNYQRCLVHFNCLDCWHSPFEYKHVSIPVIGQIKSAVLVLLRPLQQSWSALWGWKRHYVSWRKILKHMIGHRVSTEIFSTSTSKPIMISVVGKRHQLVSSDWPSLCL